MATKAAQEEGSIHLSYKWLAGILASTLVLVGGQFYLLVIDDTRIELEELQMAHRALSQKVIGIQHDDDKCMAVNITQEADIENLEHWRDEHMKMMYKAIRESDVWKAEINKDMATLKNHIDNHMPFYYR